MGKKSRGKWIMRAYRDHVREKEAAELEVRMRRVARLQAIQRRFPAMPQQMVIAEARREEEAEGRAQAAEILQGLGVTQEDVAPP